MYHGGGCVDGFTAAVICKMELRRKIYKSIAEDGSISHSAAEIVLCPAQYQCDHGIKDFSVFREVYIVDFSLPKDEILDIEKVVEKLVVLDHHKTARDNLQGLSFAKFDTNKSAAMMAWEYFNLDENDYQEWKKPPYFVKLVQDRDLFIFEMHHSEAFNEYIRSFEFDEERYEGWINNFDSLGVFSEAYGLMRYKEKMVKSKVGHSYKVQFGNNQVKAINSSVFISDIGKELAGGEPFVVIYFETEETIVFCLRSERGGEKSLDVSEIAKSFGGGGHANAAGFTMKKEDFYRKYLSEGFMKSIAEGDKNGDRA